MKVWMVYFSDRYYDEGYEYVVGLYKTKELAEVAAKLEEDNYLKTHSSKWVKDILSIDVTEWEVNE